MKTRRYAIKFYVVAEFPDDETPNAAVVAGAVKSMLRLDGSHEIGGVKITSIQCDSAVYAHVEQTWEASEE